MWVNLRNKSKLIKKEYSDNSPALSTNDSKADKVFNLQFFTFCRHLIYWYIVPNQK